MATARRRGRAICRWSALAADSPWLVLLFLYPGDPPRVLTSISLAVAFANAVSGGIAYARQRRIDYRTGLVFACATIPSAILGAYAVRFIPRALFNALFGALLLQLAALLFARPAPKPVTTEPRPGETLREVRDRYGILYRWSFSMPPGVAFSVFIGFLSSLLGIGGGIIHVPVMVLLLGFPVHIATATSQFTWCLLRRRRPFPPGSRRLRRRLAAHLLIGVGVVLGAQLESGFIAARVRPAHITRVLAVALGRGRCAPSCSGFRARPGTPRRRRLLPRDGRARGRDDADLVAAMDQMARGTLLERLGVRLVSVTDGAAIAQMDHGPGLTHRFRPLQPRRLRRWPTAPPPSPACTPSIHPETCGRSASRSLFSRASTSYLQCRRPGRSRGAPSSTADERRWWRRPPYATRRPHAGARHLDAPGPAAIRRGRLPTPIAAEPGAPLPERVATLLDGRSEEELR
ncbi:MAG: sulfite exporter TauE/SafE family protein [Dehalococcoidia bacterium]